MSHAPGDMVVQAEHLSLRYGEVQALVEVSCEIPAGALVGVVGPDGVGKSSLLALIAGVRRMQAGELVVLGKSMASARHRARVGPRIAYMPQGLGRNLYPTLSIEENLQFFARLFGQSSDERRRRIDSLTRSTDLHGFLSRPDGKLSGGMKQKLGLCCALIHDPDLLILDEPTTGVDPLARRQFWDLIDQIRGERPAMSVIVATAYMEEAERFDHILALDGGRVLAQGSPRALMQATQTRSLEAAFIQSLPEARRQHHRTVILPPLPQGDEAPVAIEASDLTLRFGDFMAVDHVSFRIRQGEIFGFLGSNGCGKTTTMKMLTGLLPATEGQAWLFGHPVAANDLDTRARVGYMSQAFSLYGELTVAQNLHLHARLFGLSAQHRKHRVAALLQRFSLDSVAGQLPNHLPLGIRQRLSLAVAMVHQPELLILDEPTSGVDPVARDQFWQWLIELSRRDGVTIFISTHFMHEAERCDRISLMHAGKVLASDTPMRLIAARRARNLDDAFVAYLQEAVAAQTANAPVHSLSARESTAPSTRSAAIRGEAGEPDISKAGSSALGPANSGAPELATFAARPAVLPPTDKIRRFDFLRLWTYSWREALELRRDPLRATLALVGSLILLVVMGYGISMDVNDLPYAVLDRDQSSVSQSYTLSLYGANEFIERPPLLSADDMDRRLRSGELALAIEIPPDFGRNVLSGRPVEIGAWVDGAMPARAETVQGYVQGMHQHWLGELAQRRGETAPTMPVSVETRFRYNPQVESLPAMVPAIIPLLLLMLPSMLTALAVVREKELGSITNFYVTPVTRLEFLLGKQLPYVGLAMINFALMTAMAVWVFGVALTGSLLALTVGALLFSLCATGLGLLASAVTRSQVAAIFFTMIGTLLPAAQFSGLINPVSSLEGVGRVIGEIYPATHIFLISRGVFNKALGFGDMWMAFVPLIIAVPVILLLAVAMLRKQER